MIGAYSISLSVNNTKAIICAYSTRYTLSMHLHVKSTVQLKLQCGPTTKPLLDSQQEALLLQRDRATLLLVQILQTHDGGIYCA